MKTKMSQSNWLRFARIIYAFMIILQSILIRPSIGYAATSANVSTLTFVAKADAMVSSSEPTTNFGSSNLISVAKESAPADAINTTDMLLTFDLTEWPIGATILSAQLVLNQEDSSGSAEFLVQPDALTAAWDEATVTWDSKPAATNQGDAAILSAVGGGQRTLVVTEIVRKWADSTMPNFGILVHANEAAQGGRFFSARENTAQAPKLMIDYQLNDAPSLAISTVPVASHRLAAQLLEELRYSPMAPGWEHAHLGHEVRPLYRPDIDGVAYYEFAVVRAVGIADTAGMGEAAGFIVVSTGEHDYPIAHWGFDGLPPTRQLDQIAHEQNKVAAKFYKLDTLSYVAEDVASNLVASLGEIPAKLTGMDPAWLDQPQQIAASMPGEGQVGGDGQFHPGAQTVTGTLPPASLHISAWDSWSALKDGFSDSFGVLAEDLRRQAAKEWNFNRRAEEIGDGLRKGDQYIVGLLALPTPNVATSGPGTQYIQSEVVSTDGEPSGFLITVLDADPTNVVPFQVEIAYGNGVSEILKFRILELGQNDFHAYIPFVNSDSGNDLALQAATVNSPQAVQGAYDWHYFSAGGPEEQRRYKQIQAHVAPNKANCYSGCGPTAWAMLFGWVDLRAGFLDTKWRDRFGIYRWNGSRLGDELAPYSMDAGVMNMIVEINRQVGTFCVWGQGATLPWDMDQVTDYLNGRTGAAIGTTYNVLGLHTDHLYDEVIKSVAQRQTPAIIGTGWLSSAHYPLAHGYAFRVRRIDGEDETQKMLLVNQGWGGSNSQWIHGGTFFVGTIWPCFEMAYGFSKCTITPRDVN